MVETGETLIISNWHSTTVGMKQCFIEKHHWDTSIIPVVRWNDVDERMVEVQPFVSLLWKKTFAVEQETKTVLTAPHIHAKEKSNGTCFAVCVSIVATERSYMCVLNQKTIREIRSSTGRCSNAITVDLEAWTIRGRIDDLGVLLLISIFRSTDMNKRMDDELIEVRMNTWWQLLLVFESPSNNKQRKERGPTHDRIKVASGKTPS